MESSIKFIFKTLFKVPMYILISYTVFNIFAFGLTYFKLLGFSYVVMQTAVENNYIPASELTTLNNYLKSISSTGVVDKAEIILTNSADSSIASATKRRQYGMPVTIGVKAHYKFIFPLMPKDQLNNTSEGFIGYDDTKNFSGYASEAELENRRKKIEDNVKNNIIIEYTVPGLKYYPDLV